MAEVRVPDESARIALFARDELELLVEAISTKYPDLRVGKMSLVSALVLAARRSPIETVAAVLSTYWERAAEVAPLGEIVGGFIRAYS